MFLLISLLLVAQGDLKTGKPLWAAEDALIEDSLGAYVDFAVDYNYSNGDMYVACIPDSGTYFGPDYWGLLVFRSTDHGESGETIISDVYFVGGTRGKDIDLVATRSDTIYALVSWYDKIQGYDEMRVAKIYDDGGSWTITWIGPIIDATEIRAPKLVRDDFDDFYLYLAYLVNVPDRDSLIILRSADRGYNWSNFLRASTAGEWQDQDICVADSSLYHLSTFQSVIWQTLQFGYWRHRGISAGVINLFRVYTPLAEPVKYPRLGVTTTLPDTTQLVYAFFSQENSVSGDYDLLYMYSKHGGDTFVMTPDTAPDTLVKGSSSPILCDLRGYQADTNRLMDLTYCFTSPGPDFENFWCWSSESDPTNWQGTTSVATGAYRSFPELVYSPGASEPGAGVAYNDSLGNLWLDAPWKVSGVNEDLAGNKGKISSQIVFAGSTVEIGSTGAVVYDITGRKLLKLDTGFWDLKDRDGKDFKGGIYFIVDKYGNRLKLLLMK